MVQRDVSSTLFSLGLLLTSLTRFLKGIRATKFREGEYNKAFLLAMDNGAEVVAKIPNPNAGPAYYTTASEVATIDWVGYGAACDGTVADLASSEQYWASLCLRYSIGALKRRTKLGPNTSLWRKLKASFSVMYGTSLEETQRTHSLHSLSTFRYCSPRSHSLPTAASFIKKISPRICRVRAKCLEI